MKQEIEDWLSTWARNCGAPKKVFVGQFNAIMIRIFNEICLRAENKMQITGKLEGAHYAAMREVFEELKTIINEHHD